MRFAPSARTNDKGRRVRQKAPHWPSLLVTLFLLALALLLSPPLLEHFVSLDWRLGNLRPLASGLALLFGCLAAASLLLRERINVTFGRWFPTCKEFGFAVASVVLSLAFTVVAVEAGLRLLHLPFKDEWTPVETALGQFDPELGWTYVPNRTFVWEYGSERRKVTMHLDAMGLRVPAPGVKRDPSAPSVLFVGCSYTMGHGVSYEESFVGQLESMPGFTLQVVNLGVQGYGTDQSLLMLKRWLPKFNTRAVVYTFFAPQIERNAVDDHRLFHWRARYFGTKPLFSLTKDAKLQLGERPVRYQDLSYSHVWATVRTFLTRWGPKPAPDLTRALVREMKEYVESQGAVFLVVDWTRPEETTRRGVWIFRGLGLNLLDPQVNAPPNWEEWRIPGDGHPAARAHQRVAQLVAEGFKRLGLIEARKNPAPHRPGS